MTLHRDAHVEKEVDAELRKQQLLAPHVGLQLLQGQQALRAQCADSQPRLGRDEWLSWKCGGTTIERKYIYMIAWLLRGDTIKLLKY